MERTARTETRRIDRTIRSVGQRNRDPLAQSFIIDETDGCFITSLTAFFASKSSTIPVRAEIREILKHYHYEITDEKTFKDEIASFIYNLSEH